MTDLEWVLSAACALLIWLLVRSYRKRMIIRHLFIDFTDWSATKIDDMIEAAESQADAAERRLADIANRAPRPDDSKGDVYFSISEAKREWGARIDILQERLRLNGMRPLDLADKDDPVLSPWISGIK